MIDQKEFDRLAPLAAQWAKSQEKYILQHGVPLTADQMADARRAGVKDIARVRVLVVNRIPLPDDRELAEAARHAQIITDASRGVTIGHGIIIRADSWRDRELLLHQLVHVAQCERSGGLEKFVNEYLLDRRSSSRNFSLGKGLGEGWTAAELLADRKTVAEGALTAPVLKRCAEAAGVDMPIVKAVCLLLEDGASVDEVVEGLLARPLRSEGV